jgi:hypothetical protein
MVMPHPAPSIERTLSISQARFGLRVPIQRPRISQEAPHIAGALDAPGTTVGGVFARSVSGRLTSIGSLPQSSHDAAGAMIGAAPSPAALEAGRIVQHASHTGAIVRHLPVPFDLAAATVGGTTYRVGTIASNLDRTRTTTD